MTAIEDLDESFKVNFWYATFDIAISSNEKRFQQMQEHSSVFGFLYDIQNVPSPANKPKFFLFFIIAKPCNKH